MGVEANAFSPYSDEVTEATCFASTLANNEVSISRFICNKKKYEAFYTGDLDTSAKMYKISQQFPMSATGKFLKNRFV